MDSRDWFMLWLFSCNRLRSAGVSRDTLVKHSGVLGAAAAGLSGRRAIGVDEVAEGSDLRLLDLRRSCERPEPVKVLVDDPVLGVAGFFVALFDAEGMEKAMFKHLSKASLVGVDLEDLVGPATIGRTFFGVSTVLWMFRELFALTGVPRELILSLGKNWT